MPTLHGRLLVDGLARLDPMLEARLHAKDFLGALRHEISPNVSTLLRPRRETAETHTDQPASVDDLNREVIAKVLAKAIRRVRLREIDRHSHDPKRGPARGGPFLVHIYGRWGSGKTSLLHFLRRQLEANAWGARAPTASPGSGRRSNSSTSPGGGALPGPTTARSSRATGSSSTSTPGSTSVSSPWWWLMASVSKEGSAQLRRLDAPQWIRLKLWDYKWRLKGALPGLLFLAIGLFFMWFVWAGLDTNEKHDFWSSAPAAAEGLAKSLSVVLALLLTVWGGMKALSRWLLVGSPRTRVRY